LAPICPDEALACEDGTPLCFDVRVPPDLLVRLRYCVPRGPSRGRDLQDHIRDGRLVQSQGVQGIQCLSAPSARAFAALARGMLSAASG
jgi:hypothetical protein